MFRELTWDQKQQQQEALRRCTGEVTLEESESAGQWERIAVRLAEAEALRNAADRLPDEESTLP